MAEHGVTFEVYYSGAWHPVPIRTGARVRYTRGTQSFGNDTEPAGAALTLDNGAGLWAPRSVASPLYGLIGQNTPGRLTVDGSVRVAGEVAAWRPQRPIKGSGSTPVQLAGVLRRIGRGTDPIASAAYRATVALGPDAYWPMEDGRAATEMANAVPGGDPLRLSNAADVVTFADADSLGGSEPLPKIIDNATTWTDGILRGNANGRNASAWSVSTWFKIVDVGTTGSVNHQLVSWGPRPNTAIDEFVIYLYKDTSNFSVIFGLAQSGYCIADTSEVGPIFDGRWHHAVATCRQNGADLDLQLYVDGGLWATRTTNDPSDPRYPLSAVGQVTLSRRSVGTDLDPGLVTLHQGHLAVFGRVLNADEVTRLYRSGLGYAGETAGDRFLRLCAEEGITAIVIGGSSTSAPMGPQTTAPLLEQFDEIARTDDASIFEPRDMVGLVMRTGESKLNQTAALTLNYLGQIQPPLVPIFGDEGIRNDVTARNPDGTSRQVVQTIGPRNVQPPGSDPQGVGRYRTTVEVNAATADGLTGAAGWRINLGTYSGTWYAEVTADLDAAPGIAAAVSAVDIGDVVALANLPVDEALDVVEGVVIGIAEDLPAKRRLVTFYLIPAEPYRVGRLAATVADADPVVGRAAETGETTSVVVGPVAAGAGSFTVSTVPEPLWTTDSDDMPLDVIVGGQRVSVSGIGSAAVGALYTQVLNARNTTVIDVLGPVIGDADLRITSLVSAAATGDYIRSQALLRYIDANNYYSLTVHRLVGGAVDLQLNRLAGGALTGLAAVTSVVPWSPGVSLHLAAQVIGTTIRGRIWRDDEPERLTWEISATDATLTAGRVGAASLLPPSNTNALPFTLISDVQLGHLQTFTVQPGGRQVRYPIADRAAVLVQQPLILAP